LAARSPGDCGTDGGLVRDVSHLGEMRGTCGNRFIQRRAVAADHRDGRARLRERRGNGTADAPPATGDQRMRGTRQSGHAQAFPSEFIDWRVCVYFRLQAFARNGARASLALSIKYRFSSVDVLLASEKVRQESRRASTHNL